MFAKQHHGAVYGVGIGHTGNAYANPTEDEKIQTLPLDRIKVYVQDFLAYARNNPTLEFEVTKIGCGLAGYQEQSNCANVYWRPTELPLARNLAKNNTLQATKIL